MSHLLPGFQSEIAPASREGRFRSALERFFVYIGSMGLRRKAEEGSVVVAGHPCVHWNSFFTYI